MNLTGGQFKGLKIDIPQNTRPTLSKTRQGVFNMLNRFEYNSFFDMFSGSGLMGLEALSRGYSVMGLEINPKNFEIIKKNYKKINKNPNILLKNALNYKTDLKFDIVYLDPPWDFNYEPVIKKAKEILSINGVIVVEYDKERNIDIQKIIDDNNLNLKIIKSKKYGRSLVVILS